ncbi:MAG: MarR family winged helix-turn-helix transcriptional regulator [Clostridia bacterium]
MADKEYSVRLINTYLVRLFNQILAIEEQALQNEGLTDLSMTEIHTIEAIALQQLCTMSEVAYFLRITLGTLTTSVNRLVKKGYVKRYRDQQDRRKVLVELTDKGEEANRKHEEFHEKMVAQMTEDLKLQDNIVLMRSLSKLKSFFDKEYSNISGFDHGIDEAEQLLKEE